MTVTASAVDYTAPPAMAGGYAVAIAIARPGTAGRRQIDAAQGGTRNDRAAGRRGSRQAPAARRPDATSGVPVQTARGTPLVFSDRPAIRSAAL